MNKTIEGQFIEAHHLVTKLARSKNPESRATQLLKLQSVVIDLMAACNASIDVGVNVVTRDNCRTALRLHLLLAEAYSEWSGPEFVAKKLNEAFFIAADWLWIVRYPNP